MRPYKVRMLELLDEIDAICKENGLRYILSDKTGARAKKNGAFLTDPYIFNIMMDMPDCLKFKEIIESGKIENRAIESYENSDTIKIFTFRYVDTTTTIIDFKQNVVHKYPCVAITIKPLRYRKSGFFMKNLERMLTDAHLRSRYIIKTLTHKWVYNYVVKLNREKTDGPLMYYNMEKQYRVFKPDILDNTERIKFVGKKYPVPKELEDYEIAYYGNEWERYVEKPYATVNILQVMDDVDISPDELNKLLKEKKLPSTETMVRNRRKNKLIRKGIIEPNKRAARNDYIVSKRSVLRFDLYQYFYPLTDKLEKLLDEKKFDEFEKLFMPYLFQTEYFKKHNMGFYIDEKLFNIANRYWTLTSKKIYANEVNELIPQSLKDKDVAAVYNKYNETPYDEYRWNILKGLVEERYSEKELYILDDDSREETEE